MSRTARTLDEHYWIRRATLALAVAMAVGGVIAAGTGLTPDSAVSATADGQVDTTIEGGLPH